MKKFILWLVLLIPVVALIGIYCKWGLDGIIYAVVLPIGLFCVFAIFKYGFGAKYDKPSTSHVHSNTGISYENASWHSDKTYVPGVGYRDTYGNYYAGNHVPIAPTVNVNNKR